MGAAVSFVASRIGLCGVIGWTADDADDADTGAVFEGAMVHALYPFDPLNRW